MIIHLVSFHELPLFFLLRQGFSGGSDGKEPACNAGDPGFILESGRSHLEKGRATHSSILAWRISWNEEPGGLQSMGSQRVGHNLATDTHFSITVSFSQQGLPLGGLYRNDASKHSVAGDTMRPMLKVHLPYPGAMAWNAPRVTERACSPPVLQMPPPLTAYIMPIISEPASGSLD